MTTTDAMDMPTRSAPHPLALGDWVDIVTEPGRHDDRVVLLNPLDDAALATTSAELTRTLAGHRSALAADLLDLGFTTDRVPVARPRGLRHFLRTSEIAWYGADRLARRLAIGLRPLWTAPAALAAQAGLAIAGVVAVVALARSLDEVELRPEPWQLPLLLVLSMIAIAIHELAHAMVVAHHGRRVSALGVRLHLGTPTFYCDSAEALALTRRQRIVHAAAGPWAEWLFTSGFAIVALAMPTSWSSPLVLRFVLFNAYNVASNLLPFARLDGALILADLVGRPELPDESGRALRRVLGGRRRVGDRWMSAYAVADRAVSGALTLVSLVLWWTLFGGVVTDLATGGIAERLLLVSLVLVLCGPSAAGALHRLRSLRCVDRVWFRLERRTRVRSIRALVETGALGAESRHALGVLAGRAEIVRLWWGDRVAVPHFVGHVVSDRGRVHTVDGQPLVVAGPVHEPAERGCTLVGRLRPCTTFVLVPKA